MVTWIKNWGTTAYKKFLQVDLKSMFHQKNLAKVETCSCSSSEWKSSTCQKSWSIGWARFFFIQEIKRRNLKVFLCLAPFEEKNAHFNATILYHFFVCCKEWITNNFLVLGFLEMGKNPYSKKFTVTKKRFFFKIAVTFEPILPLWSPFRLRISHFFS